MVSHSQSKKIATFRVKSRTKN